MDAVHIFKDPQDPTKGGTWTDEYCRVICTWDWDAVTKTATVTCGTRGKDVGLSDIGEQLLTLTELRERLPQLALEVAQRIVLER
jgi:hypothetical protein